MKRSALRMRMAALGKPGGTVGQAAKSGGSCELGGIVEIVEALRGFGWAVGFGEAAADEEGFVRIACRRGGLAMARSATR